MAAVWFDCDGTLVAFDRPYGEILTGAFRAAGAASAPTGAYDERFFEAFRAFEPEPYRQAMAAAVDRGGLDADPDALAAALYEAECDAVSPRPGVEALLDALAAAGHRFGVLTNGVERVQTGKLERAGLAHRFEATVASYDVGAHKPDAAVFEAARGTIDAEVHVMVGDSLDHDVEGARAAGFEAVHYAPGDDADAGEDRAGGGPGGPASTTLDALATLIGGGRG